MEKTSYNPEYEAQLENIEFYKQWIKDCFDYESQKNDVLYDLYTQVSSVDMSFGGQQHLDYYDIDVRAFVEAKNALEEQLSQKLEEQLRETAEDLQKNVFDANLFDVYVFVDGGVKHKVEKVVAFQGRIMPIVLDRPHHWPIEGISFK